MSEEEESQSTSSAKNDNSNDDDFLSVDSEAESDQVQLEGSNDDLVSNGFIVEELEETPEGNINEIPVDSFEEDNDADNRTDSPSQLLSDPDYMTHRKEELTHQMVQEEERKRKHRMALMKEMKTGVVDVTSSPVQTPIPSSLRKLPREELNQTPLNSDLFSSNSDSDGERDGENVETNGVVPVESQDFDSCTENEDSHVKEPEADNTTSGVRNITFGSARIEDSHANDIVVPVDEKKEKGSDIPGSSILYYHLRAGFQYLSKESKNEQQIPHHLNLDDVKEQYAPSFAETLGRCACVNFIDPTTSASPMTKREMPTLSKHMKRRAWNRSTEKPKTNNLNYHHLNLFEKINNILIDRYQSSLYSVPYRNPRTNTTDNINRIPFSAQLNRATPISNPAEWHKGPFCHVYIAACSSMDHYKTKVKPSLQAFVSQIDGAGSGNDEAASSAVARANQGVKKKAVDMKEQMATARRAAAAANDAAGGNYSSQYMIIFVPVNSDDENQQQEHLDDQKGIPTSRKFAVRAPLHLANSADSGEDTHSVISTADSDEGLASNNKLSRDHKELLKRFKTDFPNGRISILSSFIDSDPNALIASPLHNREVNTFLKNLGKSITDGFLERLGRYNEELRRFNKSLASPSRVDHFDWNQYFLVKESLAFTYEQMQLPREALREYKELEALVPVGSWDGNIGTSNEHEPKLILDLATAGHTEAFRQLIRKTRNMRQIYYCLQQYIFARQVHILFILKSPGAVIDRFDSFMRSMYRSKLKDDVRDRLDFDKKKAHVDAWAVGACWDLKCAADGYLSISTGEIENPPDPCDDIVLQESMRSLSKVLNFGRLCYRRLGDLEFGKYNLVRESMDQRSRSKMVPWVEWEKSISTSEQGTMKRPSKTAKDLTTEFLNGNTTPWVQNAFKSNESFESTYIELSNALIRLNYLSGNYRCATRIQAEQAEIYMLRREYDQAVQNLLPTIDHCSMDTWDSILSWRLFRLACCQRVTGNAAEYLGSLIYCFGPRLSKVMPPKVTNLLQSDLESVVQCPDLSGKRWGLSTFLEVNLIIEQTEGGRVVEHFDPVNQRITKNHCFVGETIRGELIITSNLTRPINVDDIKVFILELGRFEPVQGMSESLSEEDTFCILNVESDGDILPGNNRIKFIWTPMSVDQYLVSSVCIQWNHASFFHDHTTIREPLLTVNVLPNEPTQSIELNPIFFIPGHIQTLRLIFESGSDVVNGGEVEMICSDGLQIAPPGIDPIEGNWQNSCSFELGACEPNSSKTLLTTVKSDPIEYYSSDRNEDSLHNNNALRQNLYVKVKTSYHHGLYAKLEKNKKEPTPPSMAALLEAKVTTLERPALSLGQASAFFCDNGSVILNAVVHCNTPVPFSLKEWNVTFPPCLKLMNDGDLNHNLFQQSISEGEELFFGFKCEWVRSATTTDDNTFTRPVLLVILQDSFGKTFRQVLPLNIDAFYSEMERKEKLSNADSVIAELKAPSKEGLVGAPIAFQYYVDTSNLSRNMDIMYEISCFEMDWIIGGKIKGVISASSNEDSSLTLDFVGIPTRQGVLKGYPSFILSYVPTDDEFEPILSHIKVQVRQPSEFLSLSYKNHTAIACPSQQVQ
jgi:hypothetical protein